MPAHKLTASRKPLVPQSHYEIAVGERRLKDIVNKKFRELPFDIDPAQYQALSQANQKALLHLVRATEILNDVFLDQDHPENKDVRDALTNKAARGEKKAAEALVLFRGFNGMEGSDLYAKKSKPLRLVKGKSLAPGKGFYPQDMTAKKLKAYLLENPEQAASILSNNTMVRTKYLSEDGDGLVAEPYSVAFREEMRAAARELHEAAAATDHEGLARFLNYQAQALVNDADPEIVYRAEKAWIELGDDVPLEFTIGRECYDDRLSAEVANDPDVKALLEKLGVKAKIKDTFGVRTGIVNQESQATLALYRSALEDFAPLMPHYDQYDGRNKDDAEKKEDAPPMNFADVDLVAVSGRYRAARGGITVAQNLPNDDKISAVLKLGSRMVFHRSVRMGGDPAAMQRFKDALLDTAQHDMYDPDTKFEFTIGHEMVHSLGPKETKDGRDKTNALGKWGSVIEENKADLGSIAMVDYMADKGLLDRSAADKLFVTWIAGQLPSKQPTPDEAHRFRSIMQLNYFLEKGAVELDVGGKLHVHIDKMADTARDMLAEVVQLQLDGDAKKAENFAQKYGAWSGVLDYVVDTFSRFPTKRYREIVTPFADKLLANDR